MDDAKEPQISADAREWALALHMNWQRHAPKTLAAMDDPETFFIEAGADLAGQIEHELQAPDRTAAAHRRLFAFESFDAAARERAEARALYTFIWFDPRSYAARAEQLEVAVRTLPPERELFDALMHAEIDRELTAWLLEDTDLEPDTDEGLEHARMSLIGLIELARFSTPASELADRELSQRLNGLLKLHGAYESARPSVGPYQLAGRYARGSLERDELLERLLGWEYSPMNSKTEGLHDDLLVTVPGSFDEVIAAYDDGLIDDAIFAVVSAAREQRDP